MHGQLHYLWSLQIISISVRKTYVAINGCLKLSSSGTAENLHSPLHKAVRDTKGNRLGRGKSWMGQAAESILRVYQLTELKRNKEWGKYPNPIRHLYDTLLPDHLGRHSREWPAGKTDSEIRQLIQENSKP